MALEGRIEFDRQIVILDGAVIVAFRGIGIASIVVGDRQIERCLFPDSISAVQPLICGSGELRSDPLHNSIFFRLCSSFVRRRAPKNQSPADANNTQSRAATMRRAARIEMPAEFLELRINERCASLFFDSDCRPVASWAVLASPYTKNSLFQTKPGSAPSTNVETGLLDFVYELAMLAACAELHRIFAEPVPCPLRSGWRT